MRRLTIGDRRVRVRVRDEGESKRCPLVLIHGTPGSSVVWLDEVRRLAGRRRVVAPDLPGHGQSDPWPEGSIAAHREFVGTVCAALGLQKVVLAGHSMGGLIALEAAHAWPERVAGVVLLATGAQLPVPPAVYRMLESEPASFPSWLRGWLWSPATPVDVVDRWTAVSVQAPAEVCIADFRAIEACDLGPRLAAIRQPALVVGGADDVLTPPRLQRELAAGLPNARVAILEHAGHMLMLERREAFHAVLDPFLAELP